MMSYGEEGNFNFQAVAVLGKKYSGAWPLIIWEATTAKRNYYRTN